MTSNGNVGKKNKYCTQLFDSKVPVVIEVAGVMTPSMARPVGRNSKKGAQIAASFGSLKKF